MLTVEIQSRVKNIFGDKSGVQIDDTMILDWINDGQTDICRKAECLEGIHSANIVAGTDTYAYPTDFIKEQRLLVNGIKLHRLTLPSIDVLFPDRAADSYTGTSLYYFHHNRSFNLYPKPVSNITNGLVVWYIRNAASAAAIPEIPDIYHEDLVRYCLMRAWEQDENFGQAQVAKQEYDQRLLQTIADSNDESSESYPSVRLIAGDI
jgi:hypothetical protein